MPTGRTRVFTLGSWTPSLRTMLNSTTAECGCLFGVYLDWRGDAVTVVDAPHARCARRHRKGEVVEDASASSSAERH